MDLLLFTTAFIVMFVGHRMGDYLFQTDWQAQNKVFKKDAIFKHCLVYSLTIGILVIPFFGWGTALCVFTLTLIEHLIIDTRKPIFAWINFRERKLAKQKFFDAKKLLPFVLIEVDQTVHIVRMFIISILIGLGWI